MRKESGSLAKAFYYVVEQDFKPSTTVQPL